MADTMEIDPESDVVLVCGEASQSTRIRASSVILSKASPVFKSMLARNRFKEGAELSTNGTVEVRLPDDDATDLAILCRIIHLQHDQVPESMGITKLWAIAKVVDKYDMGRAVKPTAECWIRKLLEGASNDHRNRLLLIAYEFQHANLFEQLGRDIVLKNTQIMYAPHIDGLPDTFLNVFAALDTMRTKAFQSLLSRLDLIIEDEGRNRARNGTDCDRTCSCAETRLQAVLNHFYKNDIWPLIRVQGLALGTLLEDITRKPLQVDDFAKARRCGGLRCVSDGAPTVAVLNTSMRNKAAEVKRSVDGLCYRCVRAGKTLVRCSHAGEIAG